MPDIPQQTKALQLKALERINKPIQATSILLHPVRVKEV